ncbi:MAG: RNA pseudouridine synthase [Treponema sp.]|nr:RNA pseudouridine synthase [Treponema sp.]
MEAEDYLAAYKPPAMHTAPLAGRSGENLAAWVAALFPEISAVQGRREGDGGLIHRLDYETQGLVLFARTRRGMDSLLAQQEKGKIIKEYSALVSNPGKILPGFPPPPPALLAGPFPRLVESPFRAWGPGRKAVRPAFPGTDRKLAFDRGSPYSTRILEWREESGSAAAPKGLVSCRAAISRGFRHQIRCHLAWLGFPILNDSLYGGVRAGEGVLALRACSLSFEDPLDGARRLLRFAHEKGYVPCVSNFTSTLG